MNNLLQTGFHQVSDRVSQSSDFLVAAKEFVLERFGTSGLIAVGVLIVIAAILLLARVTKLSLNLIRYVMLPSVALSFAGTYFLPYSFVYILPVTAAFFAVVLIVKG